MNDLEIKKDSPLAASARTRLGFEEATDREDLIIPRAKLLQALSPEVCDDPENFRVGSIINSVTKEILPQEFIPIFKFTNWIRFNPRKMQDEGYDPAYGLGAMIWRTNNPLDPRVLSEAKFGPNGEPPIATKFLNFFCYFPGHEMPVVVSFSKTSFHAGKTLLSLTHFSGGDMFSRKYRLTARKTENDIGTFYVLEVAPAGKPVEGDLATARGLHESFGSKSKDIKIDDEAAEGEGVPF
jgi:hypothetical protein